MAEAITQTASKSKIVAGKKSTNKQAFIQKIIAAKKSWPDPFPLPAKDLPKLVGHYNRIPILVNGCTPQGQHLINLKKPNWKKAIKNFKVYPEAAYITQNWVSSKEDYIPEYASPRLFYKRSKLVSQREKFPQLDALMSQFFQEAKLSADFSFRQSANLTEQQLELLQKQEGFQELVTEMQIPKEYETQLEEMPNDVCLDRQEVLQEMLEIQQHLESIAYKGFIGYVHTGGHNSLGRHMECYLISKECIIKPLIWGTVWQQGKYLTEPEDLVDYHQQPFYQNNPAVFLTKGSANIFPEMQADHDSCGHLVFANMHQHLKEGQKQLNELALRFRFYDAEGQLQYYFLPSPQSLRYAQSTRYIKYVNQIVMEDKPFTIKKEKETATVNPIRVALTQSIETAKGKGEDPIAKKIIEENNTTIAQLTAFREIWKEAGAFMLEKRKEFQAGKYNHTLLYCGLENQKLLQAENKNITIHKSENNFLAFPDKTEWTVPKRSLKDVGAQSPAVELEKSDQKI